MIDTLEYVKLDNKYFDRDVLQSFNCGHPDFNEFLTKDAIKYNDTGKGITYVLVDVENLKMELHHLY